MMKSKVKKPITRRFFVYLVTLIVLSNMLLCFMTSAVFRKSMEKWATESSVSLLKRNLESVNEYLNGIDAIANSLIYNQDLIDLVKRKETTVADMDLLNSIFSIFYQSRNDLKLAIYKEVEPEKEYSIYSGDGQEKTGNFHGEKWYEKLKHCGKNRVMVSKQTTLYSEGGYGEYAHVMAYKINDQFSDTCVGYLRIDIDLQSLNQYFMGDYENIDGISIYDEEENLMFQEKTIVHVPEGGREENQQGVYVWQDSKWITVYGDVSDVGWKMAFCVNKDNLFHDLNYITVVLAVVLGLVVIITSFCSRRLFSIVTENFKRLVEGMEQVKKGNLAIQVKAAREDEVGILIGEFNDTVKNLNVLMEEVEKKQMLLKQAEIRALQQQINPHFIFNILETIMGLSSEGMNDKVIAVCRGMSSMLRYNISFQNRTSLEHEIIQMKNYVKIMQIRFENRFEVYYHIDELCLRAEFVKFTLQPLVENAISHGLAQCVTGGMIRILIQKQGGMVAISIFDNGIGMDDNQLHQINQKIHAVIENPLEYVDSFQGLGLMNTNLRLRMHFKENYYIELFSKKGKGTCIYIKIPYVELK